MHGVCIRKRSKCMLIMKSKRKRTLSLIFFHSFWNYLLLYIFQVKVEEYCITILRLVTITNIWPQVKYKYTVLIQGIMHYSSISVCVSHWVMSDWLFVTPWSVAHQAPLSMGFFKQEYWSGFPCPPSEEIPNPGIEPETLTSPALAGRQGLYH